MKKLHEVFRFDEAIPIEVDGNGWYTDRQVQGVDYDYASVQQDAYGRKRRVLYKTKTWKDLTGQEKISELAKSTGKLAAGLALVGLGHWTVGEKGHDIPDAEFDTKAKADVTQLYMGATALEKFEMNYLTVQGLSVDLDDGGSRILGDLSGSSIHEYYYGQDCLADTGYNTNPSEIRGGSRGQITAAASLSARADGGIEIYPAGSITPPLVFQYSDAGVLLPDATTTRTLEDHGCNTSGLRMWGHTKNVFGDDDGKHFSTTIR